MKKLWTLWKNRKHIGEKHDQRDTYAFMPGVLEVSEKPPHPLTRWILFSILIIIVFLITWSALFSIDIVTNGQGKIVPIGQVKTIQSAQSGSVISINAVNGQLVKKGETLLTLASDYTQADINKLKKEVQFYEFKVLIDHQFLKLLKLPNPNKVQHESLELKTLDNKNKNNLKTTNDFLWKKWSEYIAQLDTLEENYIGLKADLDASKFQTQSLIKDLDINKKIMAAYERLYKISSVSKLEYYQAKEKYIKIYYTQKTELSTDHKFIAKIAEAKSKIIAFKAETYFDTLKSLNDDQKALDNAKQEQIKAVSINQKHLIISPINGIVHESKIDSLLSVVTPAELLMKIVPIQKHLEADVFVKNEDIGYLKKGQSVEVKVNTYPFTQYGVLHGHIINISSDAIEDEKLGLVYKLTIKLSNDKLYRNNKVYQVIPGMAVVAEVKTGTRKVLSYFMEPILRGMNQSLRER